jgi:hypothetical protein
MADTAEVTALAEMEEGAVLGEVVEAADGKKRRKRRSYNPITSAQLKLWDQSAKKYITRLNQQIGQY